MAEKNTNDSPRKEYYCEGCYEKVKRRCKKNKCSMKDCDNYTCKDCQKNGYIIHEWCRAPSHCEECKKMVCSDCIVFCHYCANNNEEFKFYCKDCAPDDIVWNDCKYHQWMKCGKEHEGNSYILDVESNDDEEDKNEERKKEKIIDCPECCANRNFCGKMEW